MLTTSGTYPWSFVTQIFHNGQPSHGGDHTIFEVMTSTLPKGTLGSVVSLLAATLYQGNLDRNHKLVLCNLRDTPLRCELNHEKLYHTSVYKRTMQQLMIIAMFIVIKT